MSFNFAWITGFDVGFQFEDFRDMDGGCWLVINLGIISLMWTDDEAVDS